MIDIEHWLTVGGLAIMALVVFAESGLLLGFFLPGDTLLFVSGFLASAAGGHHFPPLPITALVAVAAAGAGDQVGYLFGRRVGPALFTRPKSRLFDPAHVRRANEFFERRGPAALIIARFVPIVRTFVPIAREIRHARLKPRTTP
ncbi:MAG: VTT domain-containing protein [Ilumatobacteraceae bacterium]